MDVGVATAIGVGATGIGINAVLDGIIDYTAHDHRTLAYQLAMKPERTASKVVLGVGLAFAAAGLLAKLNEKTDPYSGTLLKVGAGIGVGLAATVVARGAWGMLVAPAKAGWKPGMATTPQFRLTDIAGNAVDRVHMMGRATDLTKPSWKGFDVISKLQGHGPLAERTDFAPILRFEGVQYRTPTPPGVQLVG